MVELLVANGANIHINNDEPFLEASASNNLGIVKFLLKNGVEL